MSCDCQAEKTVLVVRGDVTDQDLQIGQVYDSTYRLSPPVLRAPGPAGGLVPVATGRLQIRRFTFSYANTGHVTIVVTPKFRDGTYETAFNGRHTGVADNLLTNITLDTGTLRVSAPGKAEDMTVDITNSTFLPCWITGIEWEGAYETSSRRV